MASTTTPTRTPARQSRSIAYWASTAIVVGECFVGGTMDLLRAAPFYPAMIDLGYAAGVRPVGAPRLVLLAPRLPRLKEWAYAGILINMTGAVASHIAAHHSASNLVAPAAFAGLALLLPARIFAVPRIVAR